MSDNRRSDWTLIFAVALIALGAWLLAGQVFGDWWSPMRRVIEIVGRVAWPLMIILLGVLILYAGRRGSALHLDTAGKRLYRSRSERMVAGVLGGLAAYLGVDPTLVRIVYAVLALATDFGPALLLYIAGAVIIPEEPIAPAAPTQWPSGGREYVQQPPTPPTAPPPPAPPAPPQG